MVNIYASIRWTLFLGSSARKTLSVFLALLTVNLCWLIFTPTPSLLSFIEGYGYGYFSTVPYLYLLIINGLPVFLLLNVFGNYNDKFIKYVAIRIRCMTNYVKIVEVAAFIFILIYIFAYLITAILSLFILSILSYSNQLYVLDITFSQIGYVILNVTLRYFELIVLFFLAFIFTVYFQNIIEGFLVSMSLYAPLLINCGQLYPMGLSSLVRQNNISSNCFFSFIVSFFVYAIIYTICKLILKKWATKSRHH